ncbi:hypothetical protein [Arthrobacter sp. B0490]|nr:hypothetical protein [Arthrobacter sp. B0490]
MTLDLIKQRHHDDTTWAMKQLVRHFDSSATGGGALIGSISR